MFSSRYADHKIKTARHHFSLDQFNLVLKRSCLFLYFFCKPFIYPLFNLALIGSRIRTVNLYQLSCQLPGPAVPLFCCHVIAPPVNHIIGYQASDPASGPASDTASDTASHAGIPAPLYPLIYKSSTMAALFAYAVLFASKKSVFTIFALEYWFTHFMDCGSSSYPSYRVPKPSPLQRRFPRYRM